MIKITENILEETCLYWLEELGWNISPVGTTLTPNPSPRGRGEYTLDKDNTGLPQFEDNSYSEVILVNRLRESLIAINPDIPAVGAATELVIEQAEVLCKGWRVE